MRQKAIVVMVVPGQRGTLGELNRALQRGWRIVEVSPMGGASFGTPQHTPEMCFAALVIIERSDEDNATVAEEQLEGLIEDLIEGKGEVDTPLDTVGKSPM